MASQAEIHVQQRVLTARGGMAHKPARAACKPAGWYPPVRAFPRPVTKASVLVSAHQNDHMPAEVTRSSWALNFTSRTLRAEIDLHNPQSKLLPGMYALRKRDVRA